MVQSKTNIIIPSAPNVKINQQKQASTIINPSPNIQGIKTITKSKKNNILLINPSVPNNLIPTKQRKVKIQASNLKTNSIYPLINSGQMNNLMPKEDTKRTVLSQVVDEKTDADIQELLKGHKNIIEENLNIKRERKKKKTLKTFLSPLQIATYNTYNPTPDSLKKLHEGNGNVVHPKPLHHNTKHPTTFNNQQYTQQMQNQQLTIKNAIETAKLLKIVENELNSVNETKKRIKNQEKKKDNKSIKRSKIKKNNKAKDKKSKKDGKNKKVDSKKKISKFKSKSKNKGRKGKRSGSKKSSKKKE